MTKQEKDNRVPLWERMNLTLEEAAAYTGIGTDKLRELSNRESCDFVLCRYKKASKAQAIRGVPD